MHFVSTLATTRKAPRGKLPDQEGTSSAFARAVVHRLFSSVTGYAVIIPAGHDNEGASRLRMTVKVSGGF